MRYRRLISRWLPVAWVSVTLWSAQAQPREVFGLPRTFSLQVAETYLRTDVEMERQLQEAGTPSTSVTRQRVLIQPALGLGLNGWAYHPNLLQYSSQTEFGLSWQDSRIDPGQHGTDSQFLQRYHLFLDFLSQKPYALALSADKDMTYRDYDFFSRVRVDSERYGARGGYSAGAVPINVAYQHYNETVDDPTRPTKLSQDTVSLTANSLRRSGQATTQLSYNLDYYTRQDDGFSDQKGMSQNAILFDSETFGPDEKHRLTSLLNLNSISETTMPTDKLMLQENLRLQHTETLASFYDYEYDYTSSGDANTRANQGRLGLTHQLYENLTTTPDIHGYTARSDAPGGWLDTTRYGTALDEQYTRRLGTWGNLSLGYDGAIDREERKANGQPLTIIEEMHTLSDSKLTFLNQPGVVQSSIRVTDKTGTLTYTLDLDYAVIPHGEMTEIRRITGGRIPDGSIVLVDYTTVLDPSASYTSYNNSVSFRLDCWQGLFAVYGRWTTLDYSGGERLNLRWMDDKIIGADSTWRWLHVGAEYELMDSNLSPYNRTRLFQSGNFKLTDTATVGLDVDQRWTSFRDQGTQQSSYGFIARYREQFTSALAWNVEGGMRIDRGPGFDRDYGIVRTELDWAVGKLKVKVGYEFSSESHPTDLMQRQFAYLRIKRDF